MRALFYTVLAVCVVSTISHSSTMLSHASNNSETQLLAPSEEQNSRERMQKANGVMVEVEDFAIADQNLRMCYRVKNTLSHDIWVCGDAFTWTRGLTDVETRIAGGTLRVRLRLNLESNLRTTPEVTAAYYRLPPGKTRLGAVLLELPVINESPVYQFSELPTRETKSFVDKVVFELGYFNDDLPRLCSDWLAPHRRLSR